MKERDGELRAHQLQAHQKFQMRSRYHGPLSRNSVDDISFHEHLLDKGDAFAKKIIRDGLATRTPRIALPAPSPPTPTIQDGLATPKPGIVALPAPSPPHPQPEPGRTKSASLRPRLLLQTVGRSLLPGRARNTNHRRPQNSLEAPVVTKCCSDPPRQLATPSSSAATPRQLATPSSRDLPRQLATPSSSDPTRPLVTPGSSDPSRQLTPHTAPVSRQAERGVVEDVESKGLVGRWKAQLLKAKLTPCPISQLLTKENGYDFSRCAGCADKVDYSSAFAISYNQLRIENNWNMPLSLKKALLVLKDKSVWLDRMAKFQNESMASEWAVAGALPYVNFKVLSVVPKSDELKAGDHWDPWLFGDSINETVDIRAVLRQSIDLVANMRTGANVLHAVDRRGRVCSSMLDIHSAATVVHALKLRMPTTMAAVARACAGVGHSTVRIGDYGDETKLVENRRNAEVLAGLADIHSLMRAWPVSERMLGRSFHGIHLTSEGDVRLSATLALLVLWCENRRFEVALDCKSTATHTRGASNGTVPNRCPLASFLSLGNSSIALVASILKTFRGAKLVSGEPSLTSLIVEEYLAVASVEGYKDCVEERENGVFALSQDPTFFNAKIFRESDKIDMFLGLHGWTTKSNLSCMEKLKIMCILLGVEERGLSCYGTSPMVRLTPDIKIPDAFKNYSDVYMEWIKHRGSLVSTTYDKTGRTNGDCSTPLPLLGAATPTAITRWIEETLETPDVLCATAPSAETPENGSILTKHGTAVNAPNRLGSITPDPVPTAWRSAWTGWTLVANAAFLLSPDFGVGTPALSGPRAYSDEGVFAEFEKAAQSDWPMLWLSAAERGWTVEAALGHHIHEIFHELTTAASSFKVTVAVLVRRLSPASSRFEVIAARQHRGVVDHELSKWCIELEDPGSTVVNWAEVLGRHLKESIVTILAPDGSRVRVTLSSVLLASQAARDTMGDLMPPAASESHRSVSVPDGLHPGSDFLQHGQTAHDGNSPVAGEAVSAPLPTNSTRPLIYMLG